MPQELRRRITLHSTSIFSCNARQASFFLARIITVILFAAFVAWSLFKITDCNLRRLGQLVFLTLACFWALSPTLNPWYWIWALPFLPFARSRGWWLTSGMLVLYYMRFWLDYHPDAGVCVAEALGMHPSTSGTILFDEILVFVEHLPWMAIVLFECTWRVFAARRASAEAEQRS